MDYNKTAKEILEHIGGEENDQNVIHCITRLRFNLQDQGKVDSILPLMTLLLIFRLGCNPK
ncbi:PTS transporter subunit EIIB [Mesobacillus foraminis]|uniref:PTS transporter subunit EIIB n=1 Tax=Mesobacillus foraminis TaxID=279826 RepID=UPI000EF4E337